MSVRKRGLGRGLDALLGAAGDAGGAAATQEELRDIELDRIVPAAHQPRRHFDEGALRELADSIAAQGVIQPIVLRPTDVGRYEIVAGERRWRAAAMAGLSRIPALVRELDDRTAMAVAVVENIQRADLNPLEEAEALQRLIAECGLTHEQLAQALGRSRVTISNLLRILDLQGEVRDMLRAGRLTLGHAKVLLGAEPARQLALATQVVERGLNVRETEALLRRDEVPAPQLAPAARPAQEQELAQQLGLPVRLTPTRNGGGSLTIRYRDDGELDRLMARLGR